MKNKLDEAREIINEVDSKMLELFKKRMEASKMVAEYKKENNLPILDSKREEELIKNNLDALNNKELEEYYLTFINGLLDASKAYQKNLNKKHYALIGDKLAHSYSPLIHNTIFAKLGINAEYSLIEAKSDELQNIIDMLKCGKYSGYSVTKPYKKEIMKYLDEISQEAKAIGSVNTIAYINNKVIGYNTDYYGFYNTILHNNIDVKNKDCYVLGTGGASLAVKKALADLKANVYTVSRTPKENEISYDELNDKDIYLMVNTTPVGMYPNTGKSPVSRGIALKPRYTIDIIFNPKYTQFLLDSRSSINGLDMLVGQALKAEEIWQNQKIDIDYLNLLREIEMIVYE
jgi:shikimate dehydrogenase